MCTDAFESLAKAQASALGASEIWIVTLPHPLRTYTSGELEEKAIASIGATQVLSIISNARGEVQNA